MKRLLVAVTLLLAHAGMSEEEGGSLSRRGGKAEYQAPYYSAQSYYTGADYHNSMSGRAARYRNRWAVYRDYQVTAEGELVGAGKMQTDGEAERVYIHDGNLKRLEEIKKREEKIAQEHREYLQNTERSYGRIADRQSENIRLSQQTDKESQRATRFNNNMIGIHSGLSRLEANYHKESLRGER